MRTNKELLQLLLDNIDRLQFGLCHLVNTLRIREEITNKEYEHLHKIINCNPPAIRTSFSYYWPIGRQEPRIKWLEQQIKKCKS